MNQITMLLFFTLFGLYSSEECLLKQQFIESIDICGYNIGDNITMCRPYNQSYANDYSVSYDKHYSWMYAIQTITFFLISWLFYFQLSAVLFVLSPTRRIPFYVFIIIQHQINWLMHKTICVMLNDCLECLKINDLQITLSSVNCLCHIFKTWRRPMYLQLNDIENEIIIKMISFIISDKPMNTLKYQSTVCLFNFAYFYTDNVEQDKGIPQASQSNIQNICICIQCIDEIIFKYSIEHFVDASVINNILIQLQRFADPCQSNELLFHLSSFYHTLYEHTYHLESLLEYECELLWQINTLLLFEENDEILTNILPCYNLISMYENDDETQLIDLELFTDEEQTIQLRNKYFTKQHRNILLFDGFVLGLRNIY
eukprot:517015_1